MEFVVQKNRKGEKVLTVKGFKDKEPEYGQEDNSDSEDKTLFINLNKLFQK